MRKKIGIVLSMLLIFLIIIILNVVNENNNIFNIAKKENEGKHLVKEIELPENSFEIEAGTQVKLPEGWYTTFDNNEENGEKNVTKEIKIATVMAISVGNGDTVPVPIGFYYVGGNFETGVVISDNKNDQNKYLRITDNEGNLYVGTDLEGNQFVWIPCTEEEYVKCNVWDGTTQTSSKYADGWWETRTSTSEKTQIKKYGGFYVARYEAGLAETIKEYEEAQKQSSTVYNVEGIPQSKAGILPWNFIKWETAQKNAQSMYNTNYVKSGLITGTQWDVMLNKIASEEGKSLTNSKDWANYYLSEFEYYRKSSKLQFY